MYKTIQTDSLEIFKHNNYFKTDIGMVSDNAYLSVIATNNCQCNCPYCINSETDRRLNLPLGKALSNIKKLVAKYHVKEAIILGGEPLLYSDITGLIYGLKAHCGLEKVRLTTNGIRLAYEGRCNAFIIDELCDAGLDGINISFHNEDFISFEELAGVYDVFKARGVKVRINTNIWQGNLSHYANEGYAIFENPKTLGFVRYLLIPTEKPIIINWNIGSTVSEQVCENDIGNRQVNTFKCLVNGEISLSWNTNNIIKL